MVQENSPCGVFAKESNLLFNMVANQPVTVSNVNWLAMFDTLEHTDQSLYARVTACRGQWPHKNTR